MLPKSVPTTPGAPAIAADRPQLKIAPRAQDARNGQQDSSVVINDELSGWHGEWRRTLETMKATLADLGQACESAIDAREAEVAGLIDTLVESARAEATTAAEQTREQAQIEITRLQQSLAEVQTRADTLQRDLDAERNSVKTLKEQLEIDGAARVRAETERDEARRECLRHVSAAELQAQRLRSEPTD
jgi:chromosome segregation ATPase